MSDDQIAKRCMERGLRGREAEAEGMTREDAARAFEVFDSWSRSLATVSGGDCALELTKRRARLRFNYRCAGERWGRGWDHSFDPSLVSVGTDLEAMGIYLALGVKRGLMRRGIIPAESVNE